MPDASLSVIVDSQESLNHPDWRTLDPSSTWCVLIPVKDRTVNYTRKSGIANQENPLDRKSSFTRDLEQFNPPDSGNSKTVRLVTSNALDVVDDTFESESESVSELDPQRPQPYCSNLATNCSLNLEVLDSASQSRCDNVQKIEFPQPLQHEIVSAPLSSLIIPQGLSWFSQENPEIMAEVTDSLQSTIPMPPEVDTTIRNNISSLSQQRNEIHDRITSHQAEVRAATTSTGNDYMAPEFMVSTRLTTLQRKVYTSLLSKSATEILSFCEDPKSLSDAQIKDLLHSLDTVTVHPFLAADPTTETQLSQHDEAWYIIQASSKFELIAEVLETLRDEPVCIGIFCEGVRELELWRAVLQGLDVRHRSVDNNLHKTPSDAQNLEVLLIPSTVTESSIIHLDLSFALRSGARWQHVPLFRLVANNSSEHISPRVSDSVTMISTIASLSESVGLCPVDTGDTPHKIIQFLCGEDFEPSTLQDPVFPSSQYEQISYSLSVNDDSATGESRATTLIPASAPQIVVSEIDGMEVHTEAPLNPICTTELVNGDGKKDTNTAEAQDVSITDVYRAGLPAFGEQTELQAQFISPSHLEKTPTQNYEEIKNEIWSKPTFEQQRITTLEDDIERMMNRFDGLHQECQALAQERDHALAQAASFQTRFERVLEEARAARLEKNEIKLELDRVKMPPLPEESSPQYVLTENKRLKTELEKLKKSSESKMQDFEFVRQQYQQSSSAAAELAGENALQATELELLRHKIEGGLGHKSAILQGEAAQDALREEAEKLSLRNNVLIEQLRRMRDEKMIARGREGRRDIALQDRKRASSASAEVGQRKKVDKVGQSRLSVAALMSPDPNDSLPQFQGNNSKASLQQMLRGQSHDSRAYPRDKAPKRIRTPF